MTHTTLIAVNLLSELLDSTQPPFVVDCRFDLGDPAAGHLAYQASHIPGAVYAHLDDVLSGARTGRNGRHPLPSRETFGQAMARLGLDRGRQVVAYDNAGGMYAARLWWLLRWSGHAEVAVLNGGFDAWLRAGLPLSHEQPMNPPLGNFAPGMAKETLEVDFERLYAGLGSQAHLVLDARAPDRFRGENENMDPIGGHIPGAHNRFFRNNLDVDGLFKSPERLREEFEAVLNGQAVTQVVCQCGSGVTACHNLLALEVAGLQGARLYPGSWSEWCMQPGAPIQTGDGSTT